MQNAGDEFVFKSISPGERPHRLLKERIQDDRIEKGIGVVCGQQYRTPDLQRFRVGDHDLSAEYADGQPGSEFKEPVEQIGFSGEYRKKWLMMSGPDPERSVATAA